MKTKTVVPAGSHHAGDWHGHPNFQCNDCAFATVVEREMIIHRADRHPPRATKVPLKVPLLSPGEQPITERPATDKELEP